MLTSSLQSTLQQAFPDATITLNDYKHDGVHLVVEIASEKFRGLSLVKQHRLVYQALQPYLKSGELHALKIKTSAKET